jgi:hypothetical protein
LQQQGEGGGSERERHRRGQRERDRERQRERINRFILYVFKRKKREGGREKKVHGTALVSPLKQILVNLALVIKKILKTSPCN